MGDQSPGLRLKCPTCGKPVRIIPFMEHATMAVDRTCMRGHRWRVVARPSGKTVAGHHLHIVEWQPV